MSATPQANLYFLPWVRQGAAAAITIPDLLGQQKQPEKQPGVASVDITLKVNDASLPKTTVQLRGPGDVVGIDPHQIVRTDPRPASNDFESNCFPSIEFDRPDFPWLFTPASANADSKLRPWLCLIVVRKQEGVTLSSPVDAPLTMLQIAPPAQPFVELPDLGDSWAWAHAQAAALDGSPTTVKGVLGADPQLSLSRLICPRALAADTAYIACVVPTFELGRMAGLGPITDEDVTQVALAPAWILTASTPLQVQLPVYYSWEFHTGPGGDFEALAQKLTSSVPEGLGRRIVDIRHPGFALPADFPKNWPADFPQTTTVQVEGALQPLGGSEPPVLWSDTAAPEFEKALADIVNQPALDSTAQPLLAPPLYGRWHAGRATATVGAVNWFDELNLDPRWRVVAAVGTRVIQQHQEALMASAWEQAAAMQHVNQRMRQLQLSMAVGESLHARHLTAIANRDPNHINEEMLLRVAAPAFSRLRNSFGRTLVAQMAGTSLPVPATRTAMRRIGRQRGPLTRRIAAQGYGYESQSPYARLPDNTWVARLNYGGSLPPPAPPAPVYAKLPTLPTTQTVIAAVWNYGFQITAEGQPLAALPAIDLLPGDWDYPGYFRSAIVDHLSRIRPAPPSVISSHITMSEAASLVLEQMNPRTALARLARAAVSTGDNVLQPTATGVTPIGVETVMMAPSFPQPMYEPLQELSQELLLPGLDTVKPDTVLGLKTNRAFVEAYMVGLNFEMARELLWRGFPTDQQSTYFKNFWAYDAANSVTSDIDDLRKQPDRTLGATPANAPAEQFVLLLRSSLLRRYPNTLIYLSPVSSSASGTAPDEFPIFNGLMDPDISFFGFRISVQAAIGDGSTTGYFVIIQEHPTEPRFGLDANTLPPASHLVIATPPGGLVYDHTTYTWGRNAAHMAGITRRRAVRLAIRVSQLLASN